MLSFTLRHTTAPPLTASLLSAKPMDTPSIEAAFRDWWIDSYNRPPNPQAVMTHVAFTEHMLQLMELLEVVGDD